MKVIVTAGGTGGHIYPALALIEEIQKDKNNEVLYIGTKDRMESTLIPEKGIPYESIEIYGLTKNMKRNIKNIKCIISSYKKCKKIMSEFKPDVVIGFGGYVSFPVIMAAKKMGIKTCLHEQNYIPGKANKYLGKLSDKVFVSFDSSDKYFDKDKVIYSGNPCGERALNVKPYDKTKLGFKKTKKLILIVMGSLGSSVINEKLTEFLKTYESKDKEILFITGKSSYEKMKELAVPNSTKIIDYFNDLAGLMKSADLIISRAGASTISEILSVNIPSILIPSPYVANNHQYYNALDLKNKGLSLMLEQENLTSDSLISEIESVLDDKKINIDMKNKLKEQSKLKASTVMYTEIKSLIGE